MLIKKNNIIGYIHEMFNKENLSAGLFFLLIVVTAVSVYTRPKVEGDYILNAEIMTDELIFMDCKVASWSQKFVSMESRKTQDHATEVVFTCPEKTLPVFLKTQDAQFLSEELVGASVRVGYLKNNNCFNSLNGALTYDFFAKIKKELKAYLGGSVGWNDLRNQYSICQKVYSKPKK